MVRAMSPAAAAKLAENCGTESVLIVEIQWVPNGGVCAYADRKIADSVLGQIVEISSIDSSVKADGSTDSSQVRLVLEDTDGAIKAICANHDLVKRPVWVYQWFDGLDLADKFLLFKGEINSPFFWDEGARTVSFDVTTRIEEVEVGFSMEEGDFPVIPPDALGKAWPLAFGSVCDVKAVQVRSPRYGILQSGEGIHDYTLQSRICQARYIQCPNVPLGQTTTVTPTTPIETTTGETGTTTYDFKTTTTQNYGPDQACVEDRWFTICNLIYQLEQQLAYEHKTMTIRGATTIFPQGHAITLNIEGGKFTGSFSGDVFTITSREHPDYEINPPSQCTPIADRSFQDGDVLNGCDWVATAAGTAWYDASVVNGSSGGRDIMPQDVKGYCDEALQGCRGMKSVGGPVDSQKAFDDMATDSFFWARAGSKVFLEAEAEVLYIVNLLPCTITRVAAMKQTNFGPKLMTVPADWYTIYETDYDGYTVTEIGMTKPLSQRTEIVTNPDGTKRRMDSKWSDDLYVTLTSSVGPNPVDIISWLIQKYTSLGIDTASFDHVRTRLTNYPAAIALLERKNVMELVADITAQSRCVVYVRNDVVYLKYASEEPASAATIIVSDVLANSLKVTLSSNDEVATKHTVIWSRSQSEGELKVILKHNVAKYGTREKDHDYYTLNIYDNVLKSATFWAIRDANIWKLVEFTTPLKHLALEVFDCVTLDVADVAPAPVKALITAVKYDVANEQISFTCWTPLKAGQNEPYIHAWPADIPAGTVFPTAEEREEGLGYDFTVAPPAGHLLYTAPVDDGQPKLLLTSGDPHPSDLDDVLESCFCPATDDAIVDEQDPVFDALKKAQKANRDTAQSKMDAGAGGINDQNKKPKKVCGAPQVGAGCLYEVRVTYCTPTQIHCKDCNCGNCDTTHTCFCGPYTGIKGDLCFGMFYTMCHTFGAMFSASLFAGQLRAQAASCHWQVGKTDVYSVTVNTIPDPNGLDECEPMPGDQNKPRQGQTYKPSLA